ncbi:MAG: 16S rRNA (cytidine(1402)-2'-O)-methyltransferase [Patescibacteria group bacterium]
MTGELYVVATPIGNLDDITLRALKVLNQVDAVVCEDTRVTQKLLQRHGLRKPLLSYHHHSSAAQADKLIGRLLAGESLAYVSDAGTPGVSDPGGKLVAAAAANNIKVVPIPGATAVAAVLSVAGIPTQEFVFLGYPPHKKGRQKFFTELIQLTRPVVFYESTHRIKKTLAELDKLIPGRNLIVGRELTKIFETIYRGTAADIIKLLAESSIKGEFVVVVSRQN